ncbi:6743_t:CDS:2 [Ambispora leptoticha]|uniref:6743_t:CDS:1 n=1 Tax=Ambispora leptoticha TaxID=144679 RepID=A0A9N9H1G8_9GLOM|nr:6743_t:CDS:2 [Ambispora leptoticha]
MSQPAKHVSFIEKQTISNVLAEKPNIQSLIQLSVNATVEEAFDLLLAENILSVPVYRIWKGHREPIALVSAFDLVTFVCLQFTDDLSDNQESFNEKSIFLQKSIGELIGLSPESTHLTIRHPSDSLQELLVLFTHHKVHRVLVTSQVPSSPDETINDVINEDLIQPCFISQTDVIRFLVKHNHQLGEILDLPASEAANRASLSRRGGFAALSTITIHDQALTAFRKIYEDKVNAVAILNDEGMLVGEISAADLRGLNRNRLNDLKKPVIMFLNTCKGGLIKPLTCRQRYTLSQVMSGIMLSKVHRAWFVDDDDIPIGVITLSDILYMFLSPEMNIFKKVPENNSYSTYSLSSASSFYH